MCSLEFNDLAWAHDVFPYLLRNSDPGILSGMNRFPVQCSCRHSCTADSTMPSGNIDPCSLPDIHISCRDCTIRCSRTFCYIRDRGLHTNSVRNVRVIIMVSGFCCFFSAIFLHWKLLFHILMSNLNHICIARDILFSLNFDFVWNTSFIGVHTLCHQQQQN